MTFLVPLFGLILAFLGIVVVVHSASATAKFDPLWKALSCLAIGFVAGGILFMAGIALMMKGY